MAVREHESIAVVPNRILGIEAHDTVPDRVDQRRKSHRRAWMSGLGLLHRIYRERANSIDGQLNSFIVCLGLLLTNKRRVSRLVSGLRCQVWVRVDFTH